MRETKTEREQRQNRDRTEIEIQNRETANERERERQHIFLNNLYECFYIKKEKGKYSKYYLTWKTCEGNVEVS